MDQHEPQDNIVTPLQVDLSLDFRIFVYQPWYLTFFGISAGTLFQIILKQPQIPRTFKSVREFHICGRDLPE